MSKAAITNAEIKEVFDLFDVDCSGVLNAEELLFAIKTLSAGCYSATTWTLADASDIIRRHHSYGSPSTGAVADTIDYAGFQNLVRRTASPPNGGASATGRSADNSSHETLKAFQQLDTSGRGRLITREDLSRALDDISGGPATSDAEAKRRDLKITTALRTLALVGGGGGSSSGLAGGVTLDDWMRVMAAAPR